jgi:hypothetical protein
MTSNNSIIDKNELVFYSEKGNIQSGGYTINNILMNSNIPAISTNNKGSKSDLNSVGSIFKDLAIPAGLLVLQQPDRIKYPNASSNDNVVEDSLYNRLLKLASDDETSKTGKKKHKTKRQKMTRHRKTKKYSIN